MPVIDAGRAAVVPLTAAHVPAAAALVAEGVMRLAATVPALPPAWSDPAHVARLLRVPVERGDTLGLVAAGELVAFQAGTRIDGHGGRWAYTADVAHGRLAATSRETDRMIERLYAVHARRWVGEGCLEHVVTVLADDRAALDAFGRVGFAPYVVDLVRSPDPIGAATPEGIEIRPGVAADAPRVLALHRGLVDHLRATPVFLRIPDAPALELQARRLADPASVTLLAFRGREAVGFLRIGPCATDVATIVRDPGTASITGAFTSPTERSRGVASALLEAALEWARDNRYVRVAVDHEAANGEASRFWSRHAVPVTLSLSRRLPAGTLAGPDRLLSSPAWS